MTEIRLDVNIPTVTGNKVTDQLMTWVPTRRRIDSEGVKLPRPFNVNPAYTQVISVDPTGDGWAYAVTEPGDPTVRYFTVPDTDEELLYSQLTRVDPSQIDQGDTLWWAELDRQVVDGSVNDDGVLYFRRRNGEVVPAGYVKGEPGPRGLRGVQGPPPSDESVLNATAQYLETDETVATEVAQRVTAIGADPTVAALVVPGTATNDALETAFGPAESGTEKIVFVSARGSDDNDGSSLKRAKATLSSALSSIGDASARIELGAGSFDMGPSVGVRSQVYVNGSGAHTVINYNGSGAAIYAALPGERTYRQKFSNFRLNGPGKGNAGSIGLDLESMSEVSISDVTVTNFETGIRSGSELSGGAVYNRLYNVTVQHCAVGIFVDRPSNSFNAISCRASSCDVGVRVKDSNNVTLIGCQIESNVLGAQVEASNIAGSDFFRVIATRFETNDLDWEITSSNVRYANIDAITFGAYNYLDNGQSTVHRSFFGSVNRSHTLNPPWVFERTQHGGERVPALTVRDVNTGFGTPVQYQAESGRISGRFFVGISQGAVRYEVDARGGVFMANRTVPYAQPSDGGGLYVENGELKYIGPNGTITTLAPA